jgi:hypothetical protein
MHSLRINTVDKQGNESFHNRDEHSHFFKLLRMEGLAVYLNPADPILIHKQMKSKEHGEELMNSVIQSYSLQMCQPDKKDRSMNYILVPFLLNVLIEQTTKSPLTMVATINLDEFNVQLLHK